MSQRDGFASGFFAGAIFGGVVGGILGAVIASRRDEELIEEEKELINGSGENNKKMPNKRRQMITPDGDNLEMESARRSLEDKIAQLNATIDEVRKHLGSVNGSPSQSTGDRSTKQDS